MVLIGFVLASLAAVGFGSGTFIQHVTAVSVEHAESGQRTDRGLVGLLLKLVRNPRWLLGQALAGGGTGLQFSALAFAPVAVVEPIVGGGLAVALVLEAVRERSRPSLRLVIGLLLCIGGLVTFLLTSRASSPDENPGSVTAVILLSLAVGLALISRFVPGGRVGSVLSGFAAGGCLGVAVAAVAIPIAQLRMHGIGDTLTGWTPYVAAVAGLLATAATQQAYARGELAWSLPALTVADPLVATVLSVLVLHETLDSGGTPFWATGAAVAIAGVALSAVSRAGGTLTGSRGSQPSRGAPARQGCPSRSGA